MEKEKKEKIIDVMKMVAEDVENDVKDFDGKPFTGKTMGEYMGNYGAGIVAIADAVRDILEDE